MGSLSRTAIMLAGVQTFVHTAEPLEDILRRIDVAKGEQDYHPLSAPMVICTMVLRDDAGEEWTTPAVFNVASVIGAYQTRPEPEA